MKYTMSIFVGDQSKFNLELIPQEKIDCFRVKVYEFFQKAINYGVTKFYMTYNSYLEMLIMDVIFDLRSKNKQIQVSVLDRDKIVRWNEKLYYLGKNIDKLRISPNFCIMRYNRSLEKLVALSDFCLVVANRENQITKNTVEYARKRSKRIKTLYID